MALPSRERLVAAVAALTADSRTALFLSLGHRMPDDEVARRLALDLATVRRERARAIASVANELGMTGPGDVADLLRALLTLPARDWGVPAAGSAASPRAPHREPDAPLQAVPLELRERVTSAVARLDLEARALLHAWVRGMSDDRLAALLRREPRDLHARRTGAIEGLMSELQIGLGQELADTLLVLHGLSESEWGLPSQEAVRLADLGSRPAALEQRPAAKRERQLGAWAWPRRPRWIALATLPAGIVAVVAALGAGVGIVVGPFDGKDASSPNADRPPALSSQAPGQGAGTHEGVASARTEARHGTRGNGHLRAIYALAQTASSQSLDHSGGGSQSSSGAPPERHSEDRRSGPRQPAHEPETRRPKQPRTPAPDVGTPTTGTPPTETVQQAAVPIEATTGSEPADVPPPVDTSSGPTTPQPSDDQGVRPGLGCGDANHVHLDEAGCPFPAR